jgi:hypothetical protein
VTSVPGSPPNLGNTCPHCLRSDGTHTDTCAAVAFTTNPFTSVPGSRDDAPTCCPECAHHLDTGEHADWCKTARDPEALRRLRRCDEALTPDEALRRSLPADVLHRILEAMAEADETCKHRLYGACRECVLAAVLPLLRAHIADQIEAEASKSVPDPVGNTDKTILAAFRLAEAIARGTGGQEQPQ